MFQDDGLELVREKAARVREPYYAGFWLAPAAGGRWDPLRACECVSRQCGGGTFGIWNTSHAGVRFDHVGSWFQR